MRGDVMEAHVNAVAQVQPAQARALQIYLTQAETAVFVR
jgi:hypothetical protein